MRLDEYKFTYYCIMKHSKEENFLREMKEKAMNFLSAVIHYHGIYIGHFSFSCSELDKVGVWKFDPYPYFLDKVLIVNGAYDIEYAWECAKEKVDEVIDLIRRGGGYED